MTQTAEQERDWWDGLEGDEVERNTAGWPPYDVEAVADFVELAAKISDGSRTLDLGCGVGRLTTTLAGRWPRARFMGVDVSERMVEQAEEGSLSSCRFVVGNGRTLPVGIGGFTSAYSVTLLQHLPHHAQERYIAEVRRSLFPDCPFAFTWSEGPEDAFLSHQASEELVERWCRAAGFTKVVFATISGHTVGWRWAVTW